MPATIFQVCRSLRFTVSVITHRLRDHLDGELAALDWRAGVVAPDIPLAVAPQVAVFLVVPEEILQRDVAAWLRAGVAPVPTVRHRDPRCSLAVEPMFDARRWGHFFDQRRQVAESDQRRYLLRVLVVLAQPVADAFEVAVIVAVDAEDR